MVPHVNWCVFIFMTNFVVVVFAKFIPGPPARF
jgi:hypothetical protein